MNDRKAMEQGIRFILGLLKDDGDLSGIKDKKLEQLAQILADDYDFLEGLKNYTYSHLEDFAENYGIEL